MARPASPTAIERADVDRTAKELAYDGYLTALLAPAAHRDDLITLAALFGELARIPLQVSDAALGEIRLQWWRDTLASGARTGHPVADAALTMQTRLPRPLSEMIEPAIEARAAELYPEPFPSPEAFDAYVAAPEMAAFTLRAAILDVPLDIDDALVTSAARTLGLVRTCVRLPHLFAKGRYPLDAQRLGIASGPDVIGEAALRSALMDLVGDAATAWRELRPELRRMGPDLRCVLLPAALAGPYLRVIQRVEHDVVRDVAEPSPLERTTRLWFAARLGRF